MKYSIIVNPNSKNSQASQHAFYFVETILTEKTADICVFFYGYAVESLFFNNIWDDMSKQVELLACTTIADDFIAKGRKLNTNIQIAGLGHWADTLLSADKKVQFI